MIVIRDVIYLINLIISIPKDLYLNIILVEKIIVE